IAFRVIGSNQLGMGHIYRALTLAHEIADHEIVFQCSVEHDVAVNKIAGYEYFLKTSAPDRMTDDLIALRPDLVVLDTLDTDADEVIRLREAGAKVASFEDLGTGARETDLTINELYDTPLFDSPNVLWGHAHAFLREEFHGARRYNFHQKVRRILLTFGGADPSDMTMSVLSTIEDWCRARGIAIQVVCGTAYLHRKRLEEHVAASDGMVEATFETGVMSRIMEGCDLAVSSNGRTTYELAHMRIPALILEHNDREHTHKFTSQENGFLNLGVWRDIEDRSKVLHSLERLVDDVPFRRRLHKAMSRFDFVANKSKVVRRLVELAESRP
ncbi:MAG TPA: cytidine 5'-phosphate N-acetylneuraminic acid synthetase, partial [Fibrobacteria bacterium]|nr:cytidine 5'-phosphate N-acetylneuraminic acid synthetase [Fibrobacteria bacterium]